MTTTITNLDIKNVNLDTEDYNLEILKSLADKYSKIDKTNKMELQEGKKELVRMRGLVEKRGKELRDISNAWNKGILTQEKQYVSIIEPIELEFKKILADIEHQELIEIRKETLPQRKEMLLKLATITQPTDDFLLGLDSAAFETFLATQTEQDNKNIKAEEDRKANEEKIRAEATEKAQKDLAEKEERTKAEELRKKEEARLKEEADKKKLEANKKYRLFLEENGYDETDNFKTVDNGKTITLYKKLAIFTK